MGWERKLLASVLQRDAAEASKSEGAECTGSYDGMLLGEPSARCAVKSPNLTFFGRVYCGISWDKLLETAALTCYFSAGNTLLVSASTLSAFITK